MEFSYTQAVSRVWVVRLNLGCTLSGFRLQWVAASSIGRRIMARHARRNSTQAKAATRTAFHVYDGRTSARAPRATNMPATVLVSGES